MNEPSAQLIALVERLRLATAGQLLGHAPHVRRLAGDFGTFDSVWVDGLAQARLLTPFQAQEINAGRGERLAVGPYVLTRPLDWYGFAECFEARAIESGEVVRLYRTGPTGDAEALTRQLAELVERSTRVGRDLLLPVIAAGADGETVWAATPLSAGQPASRWLIENGRFPPEAVLPLAQQMSAALAELAECGLVHGDVSTASLLIDRGRVVLAHPGLRGILRPAEGYAQSDLFPACYDYLAPERIAAGTPPTTASDIYACGAVWWHLLTGRPPFAGGNNLAKLQAVHAARASDVLRLAPRAPPRLAEAITRCMAREPGQRPKSFRELAEQLGPPTRRGIALVARAGRAPPHAGRAGLAAPGDPSGPATGAASRCRRGMRAPGSDMLARLAAGRFAAADCTWTRQAGSPRTGRFARNRPTIARAGFRLDC